MLVISTPVAKETHNIDKPYKLDKINKTDKTQKIDTTCDGLGIGLRSVFLIENLNDILPQHATIKIKKDVLGRFYYMSDISFKKVAHYCIIKKKPINRLFMSCVKHFPESKIFIEQWIANGEKRQELASDQLENSDKKIKDIEIKDLKKITNTIKFYNNKPFWDWISIGMGLDYHYNHLVCMKNIDGFIKKIIDDNICVGQLHNVVFRLGFHSLSNFLKKLT